MGVIVGDGTDDTVGLMPCSHCAGRFSSGGNPPALRGVWEVLVAREFGRQNTFPARGYHRHSGAFPEEDFTGRNQG